MKTHRLHDPRLFQYWKSLLFIPPTGNAMVDAGIHEEMRSALRDALHAVDDLSHQLHSAKDQLKSRSTAVTHFEQHRPANVDFGR